MAIYQAPRKRWRLAVITGVLGALAGLGIGLTVGGGKPDPIASLSELDMQLEDAAAPLDVLVIHGREDTTSSADERVVSDALARTKARFAKLRTAVAMINDDAVEEFDFHVANLEERAREGADADEIAEGAEDLADLLRGIVRT